MGGRTPRLYRLLLLLLPAGFRREFGAELESVLAARLGEAGSRRARAWVWVVTMVDVVAGAASEWATLLAAPGRKHRGRTAGGGDGMDDLLQDLRFALRSLARSPGFAAVAVLTLALGIGANSAIFSVLNAVLLEPLPYAEPDRVVRIRAGWEGSYGNWLSQPEIIDIEESVPSLAAVGSWTETSANLTGDGEPERVNAVAIMPEALDLLGIGTSRGRLFGEEERVSGGDGVVIVSDGLFQRRFAGDPSLVGRSIEVNGRARTVVGVLPPDFRLLTDFQRTRADVFLPLVLDRDSLQGRGDHSYHTVARLAPEATAEQVHGELAALATRLTEEGFYQPERPFGFQAVDARADVFGGVTPALMVLLGSVGFVLLIACANVANLLLARGEERQRELAVRVTMGADRGRVVRQLLTESVTLAVFGGAAGVGVALLATRLLTALDPANLPRVDAVTVDAKVLGFTLLVALLTGVVFGAAPALQALRQDPQHGLREGGRGGTASRRRTAFRRLLAISELAFAVVLVIGAGLMLRTFRALSTLDAGFQPAGLLSLTLSLPSTSYPDDASVVDFYARLLERVEALPEAEDAAAVRILPLTRTIGDWSIDIEGYEEQPGENPKGDWQSVTPGYFEVMGIRLIEGRLLEPTDDASAPPVVVVNRTMAESYWPTGALGQRFRAGSQRPWTTIVGVVEDVSRNALVEEPRTEMYHPHAQYPVSVTSAPRTMTVVVKGSGEPTRLVAPVREAVRALDPNLPVSDVRTVEDVLSQAVAGERVTMTLLGTFGAVALLLAVVGIYGVLSYSVSRRQHEIGIRLALGAERAGVLGLVVREGMGLALAGLALGTGLALLLTRLMTSLLYGVGPLDPLTFLAVPALLGLCALAATCIPALRASGVPPTEALRAE